LTGFLNSLLKGGIHHNVSPVLFGGNLIALEKKTATFYAASLHRCKVRQQLRRQPT